MPHLQAMNAYDDGGAELNTLSSQDLKLFTHVSSVGHSQDLCALLGLPGGTSRAPRMAMIRAKCLKSGIKR